MNNWDESLRPYNPNKYVYKNGPSYSIYHKESGKTMYYGAFTTLDDALAERDLLINNDWDYDTLCDGIDESQDGIKFLEGKKAKGFFKKNKNGINDMFWFNNVPNISLVNIRFKH